VAAPIYSQAQVAAMLKMPKIVDHDAWQGRQDGRESRDENRHRIEAQPEDKSNTTKFTIEICRCVVRAEASFTLLGKMLGYPEHALCRYETQICWHTNPKGYASGDIGPRAPHKHIYNEKMIRDGYPWDRCAEGLKLKKVRRKLSLEQTINRMAPIFLNEINVEIFDPDVAPLFRGA
jgi:hypothetical protein